MAKDDDGIGADDDNPLTCRRVKGGSIPILLFVPIVLKVIAIIIVIFIAHYCSISSSSIA